jgi:hypothetical protein
MESNHLRIYSVNLYGWITLESVHDAELPLFYIPLTSADTIVNNRITFGLAKGCSRIITPMLQGCVFIRL